MPRMIYDYTKSELESVSVNPHLFRKKLKSAIKVLLPYEVELLQSWLSYYTYNRPDLKECVREIDLEFRREGVC